MVGFHAVNLVIFCCIFVFGKLSVETLHNFLAESQAIILSVIFDDLDGHIRGNFVLAKYDRVVALVSDLVHFNKVLFRHCPAIFIPGMTLVMHFCYFVVKNLKGLFHFT